ncbi:MAG: fructose-bisphosphate aldolase, partial [Arenimonas sp.]|nr:fructose-bisphosphate aldolase [Arenimonas sp.]
VEEVAAQTVHCLKATVPANLPGIVFLSGGQSDELATEHLNEMNTFENNPWPLSFSYGRAMQSAALKIWAKDIVNNVAEAQKTVYARAKDNGLAAMGEWK